GMGQEQWWQSGFTVKMTDTVTPYGRLSWGNAIATVVAPNQITISGLFPFTWTNVSTRVLWGTNDVNALSLAATAAIAANKRKIWLGGDGRLYLALGVVSSSAWRFAYFPQVSTEPGPLLNGVLWMGDASRVFAMSGGGLTLYHRVSQSGILAGRDTDKRIH